MAELHSSVSSMTITVSGPDDDGLLEGIAKKCDSADVIITKDHCSLVGDQATITLQVVGSDTARDTLCESLNAAFPESSEYSLAIVESTTKTAAREWQPFRFRLCIWAQDDKGLLVAITGFLREQGTNLIFSRGDRYLPHLGANALGTRHEFEFLVPEGFSRIAFEENLREMARIQCLVQITLDLV